MGDAARPSAVSPGGEGCTENIVRGEKREDSRRERVAQSCHRIGHDRQKRDELKCAIQQSPLGIR